MHGFQGQRFQDPHIERAWSRSVSMSGIKSIPPGGEYAFYSDCQKENHDAGARQQRGAFEKRCDFHFFLQYYVLQEDQAWMISHLQSLRALHS